MKKQASPKATPVETEAAPPDDLVVVLRREYLVSGSPEEPLIDFRAETGWACPAGELEARLAAYAAR